MWEYSEGFWLNFFHSQGLVQGLKFRILISHKQPSLVIQVCTMAYAAAQVNLYACGMTT